MGRLARRGSKLLVPHPEETREAARVRACTLSPAAPPHPPLAPPLSSPDTMDTLPSFFLFYLFSHPAFLSVLIDLSYLSGKPPPASTPRSVRLFKNGRLVIFYLQPSESRPPRCSPQKFAGRVGCLCVFSRECFFSFFFCSFITVRPSAAEPFLVRRRF